MICLKIPGRHDACGHEAADENRIGIGHAGHGGKSREICEEGGDGEDARRRSDGDSSRRSSRWTLNAMTKKKEKEVIVVIHTSLAN
jgi:hypothetical protein